MPETSIQSDPTMSSPTLKVIEPHINRNKFRISNTESLYTNRGKALGGAGVLHPSILCLPADLSKINSARQCCIAEKVKEIPICWRIGVVHPTNNLLTLCPCILLIFFIHQVEIHCHIHFILYSVYEANKHSLKH